jgi:hypothetical protein
MATYRIGLIQTVIEEATILVEAMSPEEAEEHAIKQINDGKADIEWSFLEALPSTEVTSVDLLHPEVDDPRDFVVRGYSY